MAAAVRLNKEVTLTGSTNTRLSYPVDGVIEDAEVGGDGIAIWAIFRVRHQDGGLSAPVVIRHFTTAH